MTEYTKDGGTPYAPEHYGPFGFLSVIAFEKLKPTDPTFCFLNWRGSEYGHHLEGAPTRLITRGKRKGQPKFNGKKHAVFITEDELVAARQNYEATTGYCAECIGSGKTVAVWDHKTGVWFRACEKCGGTGKANGATP